MHMILQQLLSTCCLQLWHRYLQERSRETSGMNQEALNNCYERALVTMHKMPRIWIEYIDSLIEQGYVTRTRRALDRALAALPVTQHDRLWIIYLKFVTQPDIPMDTAFRVYRRYLKCAVPCSHRMMISILAYCMLRATLVYGTWFVHA